MSHIFPRHTKSLPPMVARGEGAYLYDTNGKAYLDGSGGAAVSCLGHGDATVIAAMKAQLDQVAFAHTGFFTSEPAERLADRLIELAPEGLDRVYVVAGGSEAMESALKLARQYHLETGAPERRNIIELFCIRLRLVALRRCGHHSVGATTRPNLAGQRRHTILECRL